MNFDRAKADQGKDYAPVIRIVRDFFLALVVLIVAALGAGKAHAVGAGQDLAALTMRVAGDDLHTRIVIVFDREPDISSFILSSPHRFVVDLPKTVFAFDAKKTAQPRGLVTDVRYGLKGEKKSRLILSFKGPFKIDGMDVTKNETSPGYRLVLDVTASSDRAFAEALNVQNASTGSTLLAPKGGRIGVQVAQEQERRPFTVVIDPGHGGIDVGAESPNGVKEKNVTLTFANDLKNALSKLSDVKVVMTRDDDRFLRLSERVRIARQHEADLFISVHADTISQDDVRGATVYTISDKASDDVARAMAERENKADAIAGLTFEHEAPEVADILIDLARRETHSFSISFANKVVDALQGEVNLINNPHRYAGFHVLRAPDVPSVLVEIGYLSNVDDEKLILDPKWRGLASEKLVEAVKSFKGLKSGH
ncbi:MAG: N-acetylmuramoyl-L-alanine amidase [Phyllobacterium sp.]